LSIEQLVRENYIIGSKQDKMDNTFKGTLTLSLDPNNRICKKTDSKQKKTPSLLERLFM